jgi:hypothetical protein
MIRFRWALRHLGGALKIVGLDENAFVALLTGQKSDETEVDPNVLVLLRNVSRLFFFGKFTGACIPYT